MAITVIEASAPSRLVVSLSGRGNEREPRTTLGPFLRGVVERAASSSVTVEMRCQQITYINSGTIGCVVEMIHRCESSSIPITVRYDRASGWQRLSFEALRVMVRGAGRLSVEGV